MASEKDGPRAAQALETLCRAYWYPLYAYTRRQGYAEEDAQDLAQEFFTQLLAKNWLAQADRRRGKFRSFLITALKHFLANEWRRSHAIKRGGKQTFFSLDDTAERRYAAEPVCGSNPERDYERRWALTLFDLALERLRAQFAANDRALYFEALKPFLTREGTEAEYSRLGERFATTAGGISSAVHRLRHRYRELVRDEVAQTVADPSEIEDEMRSLLAALSA